MMMMMMMMMMMVMMMMMIVIVVIVIISVDLVFSLFLFDPFSFWQFNIMTNVY